MKIFVPTNEISEDFLNNGYSFKPFNIESYLYHLDLSVSEKTQNLFNEKVTTGTEITKSGKTREE